MNELQKFLCLVEECLRTTPVQQLDNSMLVDLYATVCEVLDAAEKNSFYAGEKTVAQHFQSMLKQELQRRDLKVHKVEIRIDAKGNFVSGRDDLKRGWLKCSFDEMMKCVDEWLEQPLTDAQRGAILDVAREVVMET